MAVTVEIENQQKKISLNPQQIIQIVHKVLLHEGIRQASLSIVVVTDRKIEALNNNFLHHDHPTDVLAFDYSSGTKSTARKALDGEIIVSAITAFRQARQYQTSPSQEIILYIIHGILHLLGYDDHTQRDMRRMRKKEQQILSIIKETFCSARSSRKRLKQETCL